MEESAFHVCKERFQELQDPTRACLGPNNVLFQLFACCVIMIKMMMFISLILVSCVGQIG